MTETTTHDHDGTTADSTWQDTGGHSVNLCSRHETADDASRASRAPSWGVFAWSADVVGPRNPGLVCDHPDHLIHTSDCGPEVDYTCTECGAEYHGYDCGHVHQPTPVAPSADNAGKPLCGACFARLGYGA